MRGVHRHPAPVPRAPAGAGGAGQPAVPGQSHSNVDHLIRHFALAQTYNIRYHNIDRSCQSKLNIFVER